MRHCDCGRDWPTSEPQRGGTNGWAIAAFVLGILGGTILSVLFAIVALFQTRDRRERAHCVKDASEGKLPTWVKQVRCDRPHYDEVFAVLTLPDTTTYPGGEPLRSRGDECAPPSSTTPRTRLRDPRSGLQWRTRRPTVEQTANSLSFALRYRSMSGGHARLTLL